MKVSEETATQVLLRLHDLDVALRSARKIMERTMYDLAAEGATGFSPEVLLISGIDRVLSALVLQIEGVRQYWEGHKMAAMKAAYKEKV